jgi:hypothetical protein
LLSAVLVVDGEVDFILRDRGDIVDADPLDIIIA